MFKLKPALTLLALVSLVFALALIIGCKQKSQVEPEVLTSSDFVKFDTNNLQVVSHTEANERGDFMADIRASVMQGDFQKLEASAEEYRTQKTRFENGSWKLRTFYLTFGGPAEKTTWPDWLAKLQQWKARYPDSITPRLALASAYCDYALSARGSDWGYKVSDDAAKLEDKRLQASFDCLSEAQNLTNAQNDCGFYGIALRDCMWAGVEGSSYEDLFNAAIQNEPSYYTIYEYKAYYLLPRWYGEKGEWETFAMKMSQRKDIPDSDEIFARCAIYLLQLGLFYDEFSYDDKSWNALKASFHAIEKRYPDSLEIKSYDCWVSARMWDYKEAREQMEMLNGHIDLSVWPNKEYFTNIIQWLNNNDATLIQDRQQFKANIHWNSNE